MNAIVIFSADDRLLEWLRESARQFVGFASAPVGSEFSVARAEGRLQFRRYSDFELEYDDAEMRGVVRLVGRTQPVGVVCVFSDVGLLNEYFANLSVRMDVFVDTTFSSVMRLGEVVARARRGDVWCFD